MFVVSSKIKQKNITLQKHLSDFWGYGSILLSSSSPRSWIICIIQKAIFKMMQVLILFPLYVWFIKDNNKYKPKINSKFISIKFKFCANWIWIPDWFRTEVWQKLFWQFFLLSLTTCKNSSFLLLKLNIIFLKHNPGLRLSSTIFKFKNC